MDKQLVLKAETRVKSGDLMNAKKPGANDESEKIEPTTNGAV
jgi:hypothetical protein